MAPSPNTPSVNPFDALNTKLDDKHSRKDCRRLSCDAHKKCCGSESSAGMSGNNHKHRECHAHPDSNGRRREASSSRVGRSERAGREESKTSGSSMKKRSASCPRGPLFPIQTTLTHVKRTEFNRERVSPGSSSSSVAPNVSVRSRTPVGTSHATPTFVNRPPTVFTANKAPSSASKAVVSTGNLRNPSTPTTSSKDSARKTPNSARPAAATSTTPKISLITGKPIPVTEIKSSKPVDKKDMGRRNNNQAVSVPDGSSRNPVRMVAVTGKSGTGPSDGNYKVTASSDARQNSGYNIKLRLNVMMGNDACAEITSVDGKSVKKAGGDRSPRQRLSIRNELDESTGECKVKNTTINVAVRLRPYSRIELMDQSISRVVHLDRDRNCVIVNKNEFEFNQVLDSFDQFDPIDNQAAVYAAIGKPLLEHALNGYNVCLFAYGQTGSGKTYSLTGPEDDVDEYITSGDVGIVPRFVRDLFLDVTPGSLITLTYIEIYNDQIYNLLADPNNSAISYKVREHPVLGPYIPNLVPIVIDSSDDLLSHLAIGNIRRAKAATSGNEHSSRSHAIVTLSVHQKSEDSVLFDNYDDADADSQASEGERIMSKINLVDLAGSERVAAVQSTGDRFKEGTAINKSLLTLGKVISELSAMSEFRLATKTHVPYRDSTLTFLLKESLGGNSKTCMLATISPSSSQVEETLSTLRYASKASRIVNRVHINEDPKNRKIRLLEIEVERLRALLRTESVRSVTPAVTIESSSNETEPKVVEKKDKNNNTPDGKKGKKQQSSPESTSTDTSPGTGKSAPSSTSPSGPSSESASSTPKKGSLKKTDDKKMKEDVKMKSNDSQSSSTPSSTMTTPTKASTPIAAKRKGKDQGTLTERMKEIDQGTSTDVEEIPVIEIGDYKSSLIEDIESIFEENQVEGKKKRNSDAKTPDTKPKAVASPGSSGKKKDAPKPTEEKVVEEKKKYPKAAKKSAEPATRKTELEKKKSSDVEKKAPELENKSPEPAQRKGQEVEKKELEKKKEPEKKKEVEKKKEPEKKKEVEKKKDDEWGSGSNTPKSASSAASSPRGTPTKSNGSKKLAPSRFAVGDFCRCIFADDGVEYEASIKSIDGDDCVVLFYGYGNEEGHKLTDLKPSNGAVVRAAQFEESGADVPVVTPPPKENSKKDKKNKNKKSVAPIIEDESVVSEGMNTGMINSTIDITSEAETSKHVNFRDTQSIRYYNPSIAETTQQTNITANDTIDISVSPTPSKKDKKKNGKKSQDLVEELKEKLEERKRKNSGKSEEKVDENEWGTFAEDLNKEEPNLVNLTEQDAWDADGGATGGDWEPANDDGKGDGGDEEWNNGDGDQEEEEGWEENDDQKEEPKEEAAATTEEWGEWE